MLVVGLKQHKRVRGHGFTESFPANANPMLKPMHVCLFAHFEMILVASMVPISAGHVELRQRRKTSGSAWS